MEGGRSNRGPPKPFAYHPNPSSDPSEYKFLFSSRLETRHHRRHEDKPTYFDQDILNDFGLYDKTTNIIGDVAPNIQARLTALQASSFVVSIIASYQDLPTLRSSGIIIQHEGKILILTSGYILGDSLKPEVDIILPNQKMLKGCINITNEHYNIVLIDVQKFDSKFDSDEIELEDCARFAEEFASLGSHVTAVGRDYDSNLSASIGRVDTRGDHFECDDLLSSSCSISEWGIGGPLINDAGLVIGMNFFSRKCYTPFLPSVILLKCVEYLLQYNAVFNPYLGLKLRSLIDEKLKDLDCFFLNYKTTNDGLVVKEVIDGSPADAAGIRLHDVIISCDGTPLSSPPQFTSILFQMLKSPITLIHTEESLASVGHSIEVVIYSARTGAKETKTIASFDFRLSNFLNIGRWPPLPPPPPEMCYYSGIFSQQYLQ